MRVFQCNSWGVSVSWLAASVRFSVLDFPLFSLKDVRLREITAKQRGHCQACAVVSLRRASGAVPASSETRIGLHLTPCVQVSPTASAACGGTDSTGRTRHMKSRASWNWRCGSRVRKCRSEAKPMATGSCASAWRMGTSSAVLQLGDILEKLRASASAVL